MNELEIIHHSRIDGLSVFFDTVEYRTPHIHPEWELLLIMENPLTITCGMERFSAHPGEIILFNPNELHEFQNEKGACTFLCLQISPGILPEIPPVRVDEKLPHRCLPAEEMAALRSGLAKILWAYLQKEDYFAIYCVGIACIVLHRLFSRLPSHMPSLEERRSIDKQSARLNRLIKFVDENYMHKIKLSDFAELEGCSMSYLSRFIKNTLNQNFQEYVKSVRFNCACKLIAEGKMRMLDVCMESGFSDYRYFSREFQRQYHMTPEEYSRHTKNRSIETESDRHSLHSSERFYSQQESLKLYERYFGTLSDEALSTSN